MGTRLEEVASEATTGSVSDSECGLITKDLHHNVISVHCRSRDIGRNCQNNANCQIAIPQHVITRVLKSSRRIVHATLATEPIGI